MRYMVLLALISIIFCLIAFTAFANDSGDLNSKEGEEMSTGRFTDRSRTILNYANEEAIKLNRDHVDTEHLLLGLIFEGQGIAVRTLQELGVDLARLEMEVKRMMEKSQPVSGESRRPPIFTRASSQVIQYAHEEAQKVGYDHVGTEHILLGLVREKQGIAAKVLASF